MTARERAAPRRPERFALRVVKGGFLPADGTTLARLRARNYAIGDLVFAEFKRPRSPGFHRLAHALGTLFVQNIEAFEGLDAHSCLKRLQLESGVGCDEIGLPLRAAFPDRAEAWIREHMGASLADLYRAVTAMFVDTKAVIPVRIPLSLSYESMEQGEFRIVIAGLCDHVSKTYWPTLNAEQIEAMANAMVEAP